MSNCYTKKPPNSISDFCCTRYIGVKISETNLKIRNLKSIKRIPLPYSEAELLNGLTPKNAHADIIAKPLKREYSVDSYSK